MTDQERVSVTCPAGQITGRSDGEIVRFHSIPYSVIPGPFEDAERLPRDQHALIDATVHRPGDVALSIVTPADARALADLPVVVYIHGGRFEHGTHGDRRADGAPNARDDVITVHVGYRVKLEGFARFHDDEPDHYRGIDDCLLGLEWVQRNIEAFGGDPTNVTLVGQSAGATVALWLTRRDHYRGAFRRVLAMSPCFPRESFEKRKAALRMVLGKPVTRASLTRLAAEKPETLARAYRRFRSVQGLDMALGPAGFDGAELADIPILLTATRDEHYDMPVGQTVDRSGLGPTMVRLLARRMGVRGPVPEYLRSVMAVDPQRPMGRLIGDSANRRWVAQAADEVPGPVWVAEFVADSRPAVHCEEIPHFFGLTSASGAPGDGEARSGTEPSAIRSVFLDFIRGSTPEWAEYSAETGRQCLLFNISTNDVSLTPDTLRNVREAFGPHR